MPKTVKLSEHAFRRGANDAFTLKPLRDAARAALQGHAHGKESRAASSSDSQSAPKGGGRRALSKTG